MENETTNIPEENHGVRPEDTPDPHILEIKHLDALAIDVIHELTLRIETLEKIVDKMDDDIFNLKGDLRFVESQVLDDAK